jgi:hypothetical protein
MDSRKIQGGSRQSTRLIKMPPDNNVNDPLKKNKKTWQEQPSVSPYQIHKTIMELYEGSAPVGPICFCK